MKENKLYYRICETLTDKGTLVADTENLDKYMKNPKKDYYISVYKYNEQQKKQFEENNSVAGITDVITNKLVFDFDSENVSESQVDAQNVAQKLLKYGFQEDNMQIAFSGNKGIHIEVSLKDQLTPTETKKLATNIAEGCKTFDSVIYNANRLLRATGTKHQKSGLYKTPISLDELKEMNISDIKELAKDRYDAQHLRAVNLPNILVKQLEVKASVTPSNDSIATEKPNLAQNPLKLSAWKLALSQGFFPPATRSNAFMILASTFKAKGLEETDCYHLLKSTNEKQSERFGQEKWSTDELYLKVIKTVYKSTWQGKQYAEDNFPQQIKDYFKELGVPRRNEVDLNVFSTSDEVFDIFTNFAENIDANTIETGINALDKNVKITTSMLVGLLGAPSAGKTLAAIEIMKNTSLRGETVDFFSLDMGPPLVFQRLAQKVTGYSTDKLFDIFKKKDNKEIAKIKYMIKRDFGNINFSFKTALSVDRIRDSLEAKIEKTGVKPRLVVIDYLECITSKTSDPTAKISMISQELKDMANDLDICVLLLLQPPKRAGDPSHPLLSYSDIKGAATVAQACSVIISIWREGFNPKEVHNDNYISFAVLKNRMGQLSQTDCAFDGLTGTITDLDDQERAELTQLRALKKFAEDSDI